MEFTIKSGKGLTCPFTGDGVDTMIRVSYEDGDKLISTPPMSRRVLESALRVLCSMESAEPYHIPVSQPAPQLLLDHSPHAVQFQATVQPTNVVQMTQKESPDAMREFEVAVKQLTDSPTDIKGRPTDQVSDFQLKDLVRAWSHRFANPKKAIPLILRKYVPNIPDERFDIWFPSS